MGQPSSTSIPFSRKKLTFIEGFLSLFSDKYRLPAKKWEFFHGRKAGDALIEIPFVYLWSPWKRRWVRDYCLNTPVMQLNVAIDAHKKTGDELKRMKAEAVVYEIALEAEFYHSLNEVVNVYHGGGNYDRTITGANYKPSDGPKAGEIIRIKSTSSSEPHGNHQKKGNQNN